MELIAIDVQDDARVEQFFAVHEAAHAADTPDNPPPLRERFLALMRQEHAEVHIGFDAVRCTGHMVGAAMVVMPTIDNRHRADVKIWVHPQHRRLGTGHALLEQVTQRARADGRTTLSAQAVGSVPGGPPRSDVGAKFLEAAGFAPALSMMSRRVDLASVDRESEQALLDKCLPHAVTYRTQTRAGLTPEPIAAGAAYIANRTMADSPTGEMDFEQPIQDAQRLQPKSRRCWTSATTWSALRRCTGAPAKSPRSPALTCVRPVTTGSSARRSRIRRIAGTGSAL